MRAVLFLIATQVCFGDWIRVTSAHSELYSDAGESTGRRLAARFEQIRAIFHQANIDDAPLPVRIVAFSSPTEFHTYHDGDSTAGFYQPAPDCDWIVMHTGPNSDRVAFHEYVHLVLSHSHVPLPKWFDEGTAEFYSTLASTADRLRVGDPIPEHLALLARERWLTADELISPSKDQENLFYAESWALVHMLNLAPKWTGGMPQFIQQLAEGTPVNEAFPVAFGKTIADAIAELPQYLRSIKAVTVPTTVEAPSPPKLEHFTALDAALLRADLALETNHAAVAKQLVEHLPDSPRIAAAQAAIAIAEDRKGDARHHLDRAISLGSRDAAVYFEYSTLVPENRVDDLLRQTIALSPNHADARFQLGIHETDRGNFESAIEHLTIATHARPSRSDYWHALGYAQSKLGRSDDAIASARRAIATASTDAQDQMAHALIDLVRSPAPKIEIRPSIVTPQSWQRPTPDAHADGALTFVDCDGPFPRLRITAVNGTPLTLNVAHPNDVELADAPGQSRRLTCGPQKNHVSVDYLSSTQDVTRILFQN